VIEKRAGSSFVEVVIVALFLEVAVESLGARVCPIGEQHNIIAIVFNRIFVSWLNDERTEQAYLLLSAAVTVIPICPVLDYRDSIDKCLARCNAGKTQSRHAVHRRKNTNTVPVNRSRLVEV